VCQYVDHRFALPAIVGRTGSLNIPVGLAGRSGAGKGSVADESQALIGTPTTASDFRVGEAPAGSGEGMVKAFFELRADPDDNRRRVLVRARESVLIRVDEGETLRSLAARQGHTWASRRAMSSVGWRRGSRVDERSRAV
jgi:hypothetical protein